MPGLAVMLPSVTESGPRPHEEPTVAVNTVRKMEASNLGVIRDEMCFGRTFECSYGRD